MAITFNTNISALAAQVGINNASTAASSSLQKISSGSRVPQAKDDAAALAIGSKLKAEVAGLTQANNNAGQAVSLLQIADGALSTTGDILTRMKSLAVQASSGQLADSDRALLQQEFGNLQNEVDRIAQSTTFNGTALLNGGDVVESATEVQSGYLSGKGITASFDTNVTAANSVFRVSYAYTAPTNGNATDETASGKLTVTNMTSGASQTIDIASLYVAQGAYNTDTTGEGTNGDVALIPLGAGKSVTANFDALGVSLKLDNTFAPMTSLNQSFAVNTTSSTATVKASTAVSLQSGGDLTTAQLAAITGFNATTGDLTLTVDTTTQHDVAFTSAANAGLQFSLDGNTWGDVTADVTNAAATNVAVYVRATGATQAFAKVVMSADSAAGAASQTLVVTGLGNGMMSATEATTATKSFNFKVGTGTTANDSISFTLGAATTSALGISSSSVSIGTAVSANNAITAVGNAITTVSSRRADVGAAESRLAFAQSSISAAIQNTTSAQSSLLDVDVSSEITKYTNQNVLMQAGINLLGQANQQPAMLLKLLQ